MKKISILLTMLPLIGFSQSKFAQLDMELPTPNTYRTAAGAPGLNYYQQKADYKIQITIDDETQKLMGEETITYTNNSPDKLEYLWLQLDQNLFAENSDSKLIEIERMEDFKSIGDVKRKLFKYDGGFKVESITTTSGQKMKYAINKTMLRIDLEKPLTSKSSISFKVKWWYNINDRMAVGGRSGYEFFETDSNYLYTIAQFFPRMCVYNDVEGWQNKQFLGRGEFTLPFGDYEVSITVPSDHIVGATGELQNGNSILTAEQKKRFEKAKTSMETPVLIVTQEEAEKKESKKEKSTKTWIFKATNVRDFAFATSRKFIWDAMAVKVGGKNVLAMSYYPKEGNPLWERYSTKLVAHTVATYSKYTVDYPYPVAISVHSKWIGMEYPMICFNGGRPEEDGTYSEQTKYGMWGVIIHEVGHNFFPMIINSDERQWTWMDEGLNTFVQFLTEQEWERGYPSRRGPAHMIVDYMSGDKSRISPIMTNSESIFQFGNNAYGKPATALNILRETVMGRELFDYAFKTYCERWAFKHPTPADFFRTMEDASAVDLDWFWRAWFYGIEHVDVALNDIRVYRLKSGDPDADAPLDRLEAAQDKPVPVTVLRNQDEGRVPRESRIQDLEDLYSSNDRFTVTNKERNEATKAYKKLEPWEQAVLARALEEDPMFYFLDFENVGGVPSPIPLEINYEDGSSRRVMIPAEIWRRNAKNVTHRLVEAKPIAYVQIDGKHQTADADYANNRFPPEIRASRLKTYKRDRKTRNLMADLLVELKKKSGEGAEQGESVELEAVQD